MMERMDRRMFLRLGAGGLAAAMLPLASACSTSSLPPVDVSAGPVAFAADGTRFEVLPERHRLVIARAGQEQTVGGVGQADGKLNYPIAVATMGGLAYVVDHGNHRVQVYDPDGATTGTLGADTLFHPSGVVARDGEIVVADARNARLVVFAPDGRVLRTLGEGQLGAPRGLAHLGDHLLVADAGLREVLELARDGSIVRRHGGWVLPYDVATDGERLFVADVSSTQLAVLERGGRRIDAVELERAPRSVTLASDGILYVS